MPVLTRVYDFTPNTLIQSAQVDTEFNQIISVLSGTSAAYWVIIKTADSTIPVLTLDNTSTGPILSLKNNNVKKAAIQNEGDVVLQSNAVFGWTASDPESTFPSGFLSFISPNEINVGGAFTVGTGPRTSGSPTFYARVLTPADTTLAAATESVGVQIGGGDNLGNITRQFTGGGGGIALQREVVFHRPLYAFTSATTIGTAATVAITAAPVASTNCTITNAYALYVISGDIYTGSGKLITGGSSTKAALRLGLIGGDPSSLQNGDMWYDSNTNKFRAYENGAATDMIGAGGGGSGTVNSGTQYRITYYPSTGTTVDDLANLTTDASGVLSHAASVRNAAAPTYYHRVVTPADTALTASTECVGVQVGGDTSAATVTRQFATGALALQRENVFVKPTYAFVGASTLTTAATVAITGAPAAGTNATITNALALYVQAGECSFADKVGFGIINPVTPVHIESADTGASMIRLKHTDTSGFNAFDFLDAAGTQVFGVGFGNSALASPFTSRAYISIVNGTNLVFMSAAVATNTARWAFMNGGDFVGNSAVVLGWTSSSTDPTATRDTGLRRGQAGVVDVLASATGSGALRRSRYVLGSTGTTTLGLGTTDSSDGIYYNTTSSTGLLTINLPSAAAGLIVDACVMDTDGVRVVAASGDDIRIGTSISATAGRIDSSTVGAYISLVAIDSTTWVARTVVGPWTVT